ncbi:MAG: hypothetical protein ACRCYY_05850 [Trueperaceae bacterium]
MSSEARRRPGNGGGETTPGSSPTEDELKALAATYPAMPKENIDLVQLTKSQITFASGLPINDLEFTIYDTDYIDGETNGYDTFMPVDPSRNYPGADKIKIVNTTINVDQDTTFNGQKGDRIILGTAEIANPFFLRGEDGVDNDYAVITNFDYNVGHVQLHGGASEYSLILCRVEDGCATTGYYLFHISQAEPDLIAFVFSCDDLALPVSGNPYRNPEAKCNESKMLELTNTNHFRFAKAVSTTVAVPDGRVQFGGRGKDIVGGITTDVAGNMYTVGLGDSNFDGGTVVDNEVFVARTNADGSQAWIKELVLPEGSIPMDAAADSTYLYVAGRTLGALEGFTNKGKWDGFILKLQLSDGAVVATNQFGNESLDGYGNVVLDDAGNLYVSGAGSAEGSSGTDDLYLVAKHRTSDLGNVWRQIIKPTTDGQIVSAEGWGGLTYAPGAEPGKGRLVSGGWFMTGSQGSNGFLEVWENLAETSPTRVASVIVANPANQVDWVLDNAVDKQGNIYAVGYTTGDLQGQHKGNGDAYIVKYDANLQNPVFRQVGTAQSDAFRRMEIDPQGNLYGIGYTYGDYDGANADPSKGTGDVFVQKFDTNLNSVAALQFGTPQEDRGHPHLRSGTLYVGGMTEAALAGASQGSFDAYVVGINARTMEIAP